MKWISDLLGLLAGAFIIFAFGAAALSWLVPRLGPEDYVTIYQRICIPKELSAAGKAYDECKSSGGQTYAISSTFRVDYDRQRVIELGSISTARYNDCQVADKLNWTCNYNDGSGWVQVTNGKMLRSQRESVDQISWLQYVLDQR